MTRKLLTLIFSFFLSILFISTANAQTATTGSAQTVSNKTAKLKEEMQLLQKQKNTAVSQVKDEAKAIIQAKRDEFKTRIQTIRDQKKKLLVERIDTKLAKANKKLTLKFSETLVRLQEFLDKIKQTTTNASVLENVETAQTAIDTAKAAVEAQKDKEYTMEITDDRTLKLNAGAVVSQLRQDLISVHKLVVDAKQAVQKLNIERKLIKKEATGSAEL